jgi:archaellum component FlaG (FlaF/FlaG flagellin family)|tara:strand:- start:17 stop:526 length:510 start_codon:yes stop_codon:yes gene_type:complete
LDKVIVTALLVIAGVTAAGLVMTTLTPIVGSSSQSVVESQRDLAQQIETDVEITAVHAPPNTPTLVRAWIKNVGSTEVSFLDQADIYISSIDKSKFVVLCHNNATCPGSWVAKKKDGTDKTGYWIEGETIEIAVTLSDANQLESAVKTYNFEFNTANGIKSVYQFQYGQ